MDIINRYFGKIIFVKADLKEDHTIYVAALNSSFQDGRKQYALAFVPVHLAIISQGYLSDLYWVNLQTRTMTNGYRLPPQRWEIPRGLDNTMFTAVERTEHKTKYLSDAYPLEMILIHDQKKKTKFQYHNHMNLLAALTTFRCVISLLNTPSPAASLPVAPQTTHFSPATVSSPEASKQYSIGDASYSPGADGRYTTIGLSEYTVPQIPSAPTKKGGAQREMISRPRASVGQVVDDSFELL